MKSRLFFSFVLAIATTAVAQESPDSPLSELLNTPISTAARYEQKMSEVPASVTVITAEEIARYGWHTLADLLGAMRGVYTTYDRNYAYLGVRGIGLPTDYNNRFLVLIDGHRILNGVWAAVPIGTELGIDLSAFSRVEFVRGPGSVVYGTGAMFGVINLIPKSEVEPVAVTVGSGEHGTRLGSARGAIAHGEVRASATLSWRESAGQDLYYPEYDTPATNGGIAQGLDYDDSRGILATFQWRQLRLLALQSSRTKGVPTASWETRFGATEETTDRRMLLGLQYEKKLSPGRQLSIRAHLDQFDSEGIYEYATRWKDTASGTRIAGEAQYIWDPRPNHRVTIGSTYVRNARASYEWGDASERYAANKPSNVLSTYAQSEWQPSPRMAITAGASYDRYSKDNLSSFIPRLAVILRPRETSTLKLLYGRAFRVPSVYEQFFTTEELSPESVRTTEAVWEQVLSADVMVTASIFDVVVSNVMEALPAGDYRNAGEVTSRGGEIQLDYRRHDGIWSYFSYSWQRARGDDGQALVNSPNHLAKAGLSTPTAHRLQGAIELLYGSSRRTLLGQRSGEALLANLNLTARLASRLTVALTVRNLFDADYAFPGGPEHLQDSLLQDGRTFMIRFTARGH